MRIDLKAGFSLPIAALLILSSCTYQCVCPAANQPQGAAVNSIELLDLIRLLIPEAEGDLVVFSWAAGADPDSPIQWKTKGWGGDSEDATVGYTKGENLRRGHVVVTIDGEPTHTVLNRYVEPAKWTVELVGPNAGPMYVGLDSSDNWQQTHVDADQIRQVLEKHLGLSVYRCNESSDLNRNTVYSFSIPGQASTWLNFTQHYGAHRVSVNIELVFRKVEADGWECMP